MGKHYSHVNKRAVKPAVDRFWAKVQKAGAEECWLWLGARQAPRKPLRPNSIVQSQYGVFRLDGQRGGVHAHRAIWIILHGPIPPNQFVCHACDNRLCVNPAHLWLGTAKDNMIDCSRKGRCNNQFRRQELCHAREH